MVYNGADVLARRVTDEAGLTKTSCVTAFSYADEGKVDGRT
jgi:hypothetical protein